MYTRHPDFRLVVAINNRDELHLYTAKKRLDKSVNDRYVTIKLDDISERFEPKEIELIERIDTYAVNLGMSDCYTSLRSVDVFLKVLPILGVHQAIDILISELSMPSNIKQTLYDLYID